MKSEKGFIETVIIIILGLLLIVLISMLGIAIYQDVSYGDREGTIINKYYKEPYTTTSYMTSGKMMIPITNYHSETWNFKLEKEVEGKSKTITIEVSPDVYEQYNIGDYFKESK